MASKHYHEKLTWEKGITDYPMIPRPRPVRLTERLQTGEGRGEGREQKRRGEEREEREEEEREEEREEEERRGEGRGEGRRGEKRRGKRRGTFESNDLQSPVKKKARTCTELYDEEVRIVLVGKTGIGKSATGNTILGRQCFESKFSAKSMTVDCTKGKAEVDGQQVAVIDTPGVFDTRFGLDKTIKDICQCISYAVPGPHVFLVVIRLGRYTEEEKQTVQRIQEIFGQAADRYSMVLFTHGDLLEDTTIEDFLTESSDLQELVFRCNGQYHVFNNKLKDRSQVTELLQKIRNLVQKNGGSHYTNEMFQEAERAIEGEKQRILKEKEEQIRKEKEEMERKLQEKYEKEMKKMNEQLQAERERERKEREEERKREKQEMNEERKREKEEREVERKREREEKERKMKDMMNKINEQHDRELRKEREKLQCRYEDEAREEAEEFNPLFPLVVAGEVVVGVGKTIVGGVKDLGRGIKGLGRKIASWF